MGTCPIFSFYEKIPDDDNCGKCPGYPNIQRRQTPKKKAILTPGMWENGIIPYILDHSLDYNKDRILMAMRTIESYSRMRFVERTQQRQYLQITKDKGCYYYQDGVGHRRVSLDIRREDFGTVLHELMHAIGFPHEHRRPDRDQYIAIHWENIMPGNADQFEKLKPTEYYWSDLPFDYHSIMLYDEYGFSKNGKKTIESKDGRPIHGNRIGLSKLDKEKLKRL